MDGISLLELLLVIVISSTLLLTTHYYYQQWRWQYNLALMRRSLNLLFIGLNTYFNQHCHNSFSMASLTPSVADLQIASGFSDDELAVLHNPWSDHTFTDTFHLALLLNPQQPVTLQITVDFNRLKAQQQLTKLHWLATSLQATEVDEENYQLRWQTLPRYSNFMKPSKLWLMRENVTTFYHSQNSDIHNICLPLRQASGGT